MNQPKALFLDRDGVINLDYGYVHKIENFDFTPGIFELCCDAKSKDYLIFVITNQAGIGRGYYNERQFLDLTEWMCDRFKKENCPITKVYFCPHHPIHGIREYKIDCPMRKPAPGMILQAKREYNLNLTQSILIGDNKTDIQAGESAGIIKNILFNSAKENIINFISKL